MVNGGLPTHAVYTNVDAGIEICTMFQEEIYGPEQIVFCGQV